MGRTECDSGNRGTPGIARRNTSTGSCELTRGSQSAASGRDRTGDGGGILWICCQRTICTIEMTCRRFGSLGPEELRMPEMTDLPPAGDPIYARLEEQIDWYDRKSRAAQRMFKRIKVAEILAAATIPFLAGLSFPSGFA